MGRIFRFGMIGCFMLSPTTSALALGEHKPKLYVPVAPVYAVPNGVVAQAPTYTYSFAPMATTAAAPFASAPGNVVYYAPTAATGLSAAPMSMAPTMMMTGTANAPQQFANPGTAFAPNGTAFPGTLPPKIGDSRVTDEGRKDVLDDLRNSYRDTKAAEKSRTAQRKALKDMARDKYVEVIGGDVQAAEDLRDSENKEIDAIVDLVMREDPSSNGSAPNGYPSGYPYGSPPYGGAPVGQPMLYYYVYPLAPVAPPSHPHHPHHLLHH